MKDKNAGKTTQLLVNEFFEYRNNEDFKKSYRSKIYRDEVWNFEVEIGKAFTEMDSNEIIAMIKTFRNSAGAKPNPVMYRQVCYIFKQFFAWYQATYKVRMENPMNDSRLMRGYKHTFDADILTLEQFERNIADVREISKDEKVADYIEMIYRMALEGITDTAKIISIKEDMIDFENNLIYLADGRRPVSISYRLANLMKKCHQYNEFTYSKNKKISLLTFNNSYIGIPTNSMSSDVRKEANKINRYLLNNGSSDMSFTDCYRLGLMEFLKKKIGHDVLKQYVELNNRSAEGKAINAEVEYWCAMYDVKISSQWVRQLLLTYLE